MRWLVVLFAMAGVASAKPKARWEELPLPPAPPEASSHGVVESAGAKIYYATYGKGAPVILLHGGLGNGDHFAFQIPALADKYQVIAIDTRGHGRSTAAKKTFSYHLFAEDVIAVMDQLGIAKAALIGWSDGGEIGLDIALNHPERLTKLFALGTNYDVHGSKNRGDHTPTFAAYGQKSRRDYEKLSKNPKGWEGLVDAMSPVWHDPVLFTKKQLETITVPTTMADGDHDEVIVLDQVKEMAKLIPRGKLVVFENASHFVMWQDPKSVNAALLEFLSDEK